VINSPPDSLTQGEVVSIVSPGPSESGELASTTGTRSAAPEADPPAARQPVPAASNAGR